MKPYQKVPIEECGEALVAIPLEKFAVVSPHPYAELGAPYGQFSPYFLRQTVADRLLQAQAKLQLNDPVGSYKYSMPTAPFQFSNSW